MTNEEFIKSVSFPGEEWRDVVGYEGLYMVSSLCRVASLQRKVSNGKSTKIIPFSIKSATLTKKKQHYQRYVVTLCRKRTKTTLLLHRIVAKAFIPNPNNYPEIDHIDGNPLNNAISNLRWCTHITNVNNPISRYRNSKSKLGVYNTSRAKKVVQLKDNRLIHIFNSSQEAGRNGYNSKNVSQCCRREKHSHKGYQWMFLSDYEALINKSKNEAKPTQSNYQQPQPPQLQELQLPLQFEP